MTTVRTRILAATAATAAALTGAVWASSWGSAAGAATGAPACGNGALTVTRSFVSSGAGHSWMLLVYRNHTSRTCTVTGFPGVDAVGRDGRVLAHATRTTSGYGGGGRVSTVTIAPYRFASASVEWLNFDPRTTGPCAQSIAIDTIVPNTTSAQRLPAAVTACGLQVHPTVANTPQYPRYGRAQHRWIVGATVDAAHTNYYLHRAATALRRGGQFPTQVAQLEQLASFPLTGLTPAQIKQARADVASLDQFFATPGLYS